MLSLIGRKNTAQSAGHSHSIRPINADADVAARSDATVLITGETGVGARVVACRIHHRSSRAAAPLITLNCAGLPDWLLESELFGHVCGSFPGAYRDKPGLLEMAANGTLFLDEVGEMSTRMQGVLLRFFESGEIQRVGAGCSITRVNVRLVAATSRDLETQVAEGRFSEDLYFRLNEIQLSIPAIRKRAGNTPPLRDGFLQSYGRIHEARAIQVSMQTDPGAGTGVFDARSGRVVVRLTADGFRRRHRAGRIHTRRDSTVVWPRV